MSTVVELNRRAEVNLDETQQQPVSSLLLTSDLSGGF